MNKKMLLSVLAITLTICTFGQTTMELTFTAENSGQYVPLDSILVENITQGGDTTLYAPDTVLVLDVVTSIGDNGALEENSFFVSQNYPNPFNGKTTVNLYLPQKDEVNITVRDILGRELAHYENTLNRGNHSFAFYSGNQKYYLLTISGKQTSQTIKMLNANSNTTYGEKCKIVYHENGNIPIGFKSQKAINDFVFSLGDNLRYVGYTDVEQAEIMDSPAGSQTSTFQFDGWIPCPGSSTVTDIDGHIYNTVQINDQCWMKENLNYETSTDSWCFNDSPVNCEIYGRLYTWDILMNGEPSSNQVPSGVQGICPDGWHVPSRAEWDILAYAVLTGGDLKTAGTFFWNSPNTGATNASGFSALPAGIRKDDGTFLYLGRWNYIWTSTEHGNPSYAYLRVLAYNTTDMLDAHGGKSYGRTLRCVKD